MYLGLNGLLVLTSGELTNEHSNKHGRQQVSFSQVAYMRKATALILNVFNRTNNKTKSPPPPHPTTSRPAPSRDPFSDPANYPPITSEKS